MHVCMGCGQATVSEIPAVLGNRLLVYENKYSRHILECEIASAFCRTSAY